MTVIQESDLSLVQRAREGDASAFGTLYERHHDRANRIVSKFVLNVEDAADLTHDAFVKAIERLKDARPDTDFRPWISQIAARTALDWVRSFHVTKTKTAGDYNDSPHASVLARRLAFKIDPDPTPEEAALAAEQGVLMGELLDPLRDWEQEALHLTALGYGLREIARHQMRPPTALKPALFRARADLAMKIMANPERYGPLDIERAVRSLGNKLSAFVPRRPTAQDAPLSEGDSQ